MNTKLKVLYEDNHCLAVEKPAGLLTMGDRTGEPTLVDQAKDYLRDKYAKPGNVFVGVVHRLDRPVSGVIVFARTSKAASRLSEQFRLRAIEKTYLALVEGSVDAQKGVLIDRLIKDRENNVVSVTGDHKSGQECELAFQRLERFADVTLLEVRPLTGRSHQIRVQLSSRGWPIVGDRKYGSKQSVDGFIALHAASLMFTHPTTKQQIVVSSSYPSSWRKLFRFSRPD